MKYSFFSFPYIFDSFSLSIFFINQMEVILFNDSLFFIAGPCVIESKSLCFKVAERLVDISLKNNIKIIFKASYDKANRTSVDSFRGPGILKGLNILEKIKSKFGLPILTDIHIPNEASIISKVVDVLQIPAFLCRQTDLLAAAGETGLPINIKKGNFMSPENMKYAIFKANSNRCMLTERGTFFGYNRLVVDFAGVHELKKIGVPVIFDATHSVQSPGSANGCSSGKRELAVPLAKAAICQNVNGLFFEVHPDPDNAKCDGPNSISIETFEKEVPKLIELHKLLNLIKDSGPC